MTHVGFAPADPPRLGTVVFWGDELPETGEPGTQAVVPPPGTAVVEVPARRVELDAALPLLLADGASPFWAAAARFALGLVAHGLLLPGVSPAGYDAWRVGPLDPASAPAPSDEWDSRPIGSDESPTRGNGPVLPAAAPLLRAFVDAVADCLTRSAGAGSPYTDTAVFDVPHPREWADEVAAGVDAGVAVSLRLDGDPAVRMRVVVQGARARRSHPGRRPRRRVERRGRRVRPGRPDRRAARRPAGRTVLDAAGTAAHPVRARPDRAVRRRPHRPARRRRARTRRGRDLRVPPPGARRPVGDPRGGGIRRSGAAR